VSIKLDALLKRSKEQKLCKQDYIPRCYTQMPMNLLDHKYYNQAEEGTFLDDSACYSVPELTRQNVMCHTFKHSVCFRVVKLTYS
jgi:hypothetical protein